VLCRGKGQHVLLEGGELEVLYKSDVKKADGVSLELGGNAPFIVMQDADDLVTVKHELHQILNVKGD
jgi:hypothetical protein